ncbi:MAG: glycogen synthase [Candidatus Omnitrophica bacterium]|nr:glycogen synthase [Candidatus Omnitrophota bacterium]
MVSAEVSPFTKAGGMADVVSSLASSLRKRGHDVRIITPKHGVIYDKKFNIYPIKNKNFLIIDKKNIFKYNLLRGKEKNNIPVYFIDHKEFFGGRRTIYGYKDDAQRFIFFDLAVLDAVKKLNWKPDIIHCHDWHAGLIPYFIKNKFKNDSILNSIATIYTIHNLRYQGMVNEKYIEEGKKDNGTSTLPPFNSENIMYINFAKRGIIYSDIINTVSEQYSRDILTPKFGEGLHKLLIENRTKLFGILNGIDYEEFDPSKDPNIYEHYDVNSIERKVENKLQLQKEFGLKEDKNIPLIGMATRLANYKGLDILIKIIPSIIELNFQLMLVGSGEEEYQDFFWELSKTYPKRFGAHLNFDTAIASKIYAASDIFLIPSEFEPCGLTQLIAMRYGSIPIVRSTGGLSETVEDYDPEKAKGTGFVFEKYTKSDFLIAIVRAIESFKHKRSWNDLIRRAMEKDFSWHASANKYIVLYQKALKKIASSKVDIAIKTEDLKPATPTKTTITKKVIKIPINIKKVSDEETEYNQ